MRGGQRLRLLYLTQVPPSPPRSGAEVRMHGLMTALARRHDLCAVALVDPTRDDPLAAERAMREYCSEVVLVESGRGAGPAKRALQLRSLASARSFERHLHSVPALQRALDAALSRRRFDVVNVETPFFGHYRLRQAPPGAPAPRLVLDEHNIEYDILRQVARGEGGPVRRAYNFVNWWKLRREEQAAWRSCDGLTVTSARDEERVRAAVPGARTAVVPNAVDLERLRPRPGDPPPDGRTVLFFGAIHYYPNTDGILHFLRQAWPAIAARRPEARLKIVGPKPPPEVLEKRGPRVEVTGFVDDLRPHLAEAAVVIAPLRLGGGTRLKILEAMAMAKAVVSTSLGAEGLEVTDEEDILIADEPEAFAGAVERLLGDGALAAGLGAAARALVERRYSWSAAGERLEGFFREVLETPPRRGVSGAGTTPLGNPYTAGREGQVRGE